MFSKHKTGHKKSLKCLDHMIVWKLVELWQKAVEKGGNIPHTHKLI